MGLDIDLGIVDGKIDMNTTMTYREYVDLNFQNVGYLSGHLDFSKMIDELAYTKGELEYDGEFLIVSKSELEKFIQVAESTLERFKEGEIKGEELFNDIYQWEDLLETLSRIYKRYKWEKCTLIVSYSY